MGGKTGTTTQQVQIPPQVLQNYQLANTMMQTAAAQPFQTYNAPQGNPDAFVAPLNQQQYAGINTVNQAANVAQPYFQAGTQSIMGAADTGAGYNQSATEQYLNAQNVGGQYAGQSLGALMGGNAAAAPMQAQATRNISGAYPGAQGYNQVAGGLYAGALGAAQPLQNQAQRGIGQALAGAQPFNQMAAGMTAAGSQAVDPSQINASAINQYMSPYLQSVVGQTAALQNQQNQQAMAGQLGNAISQGAFGGDRAGIAAAALQGQQNLATGNLLSGLLNQGYGQALSTAQQQQGVNLGAQQANLARQLQGGQQLANIGQQGYAQGMGAAQQQAALGQQLFGQGLGAGQAIQGLGQQQYGQQLGAGQAQAGLGQQLYGQGATNAQQLEALGQQQYGQGAGTAQGLAGIGQQAYAQGTGTGTTLAGLGTQAQQNLLGAGQAQIGAGTLGQQTQQAGLSALYNQFLQQQGYPFQTAQAVANVAEGTGALSGSTTTTAQPMPFFSDERLKEDIEPIGKTFDGQNIVKFRYKNEPGTRIGLIAQDVEKHHPDAVGLAGGYRTVDYDKATEAAAKRGHFRKGGLVPQSEGGAVIPLRAGQGYADGGSPSLLGSGELAAILQAQAQALGLYGGAGRVPASGTGVGSMGYVPAPTGAVSHLVTAGDVPKLPESTMSQIMSGADTLTKDYKGGKEIYEDIFGKTKEEQPTSGDVKTFEGGDDTAKTYRGGLVRRHRAAGGADDDPYKPVGPSIPGLDAAAKSDNAPTGLKTPGAPGQAGGGLGILGAAKDIAGAYSTGKELFDLGKGALAFLGLAHGGVASRYGYEEGGDVSKDKEDDKPDVEVPDKLPIPQVKSDQKLAVAPAAPPPMEPEFDSMTKDFKNIMQGIGAVLPKAYGGALTDHHIAHALRLAMGGAARHGYQTDGFVDPADAFTQAWTDSDKDQVPTLSQIDRTVRNIGSLAPDNTVVTSPVQRDPGLVPFMGERTPAQPAPNPLPETDNARQAITAANNNTDAVTQSENLIRNWMHNANDSSASQYQRDVAKGQANMEARKLAEIIQTKNEPPFGVQLEALVPNYFLTTRQIADYKAAKDQSARNTTAAFAKAGLDPQGKLLWSTPQTNVPVSAPRPNPSVSAQTRPQSPQTRPQSQGLVPTPRPDLDTDWGQRELTGLAPRQLQANGVMPSVSAADINTPTPTLPERPDFLHRAGDWLGEQLSGAESWGERQLGINQPGAKGSWMDRNESWLVPLLKGVGTMASSPSRYFGGALLQGIGAAAQAVPDLQTQQSQVALRQAQATEELAAAGRGGIVPVLHTLANGQTQLEYVDIAKMRGRLTKNQNGQYVMDDRANPPIATNYDTLGSEGMESAANDADKFLMATRMNPGLLTMSNEKINAVYNEAASGANNTRQFKKFAETMAAQTGAFEPGKLNPVINSLAAWWDSIAPKLGLQGVKLEQLANSQEAEKLSRSIAASGEANADQRSFAALRAWMQMTPNASMSKDAVMNLITKMYVDNQRAVDEGNYFNEYDKHNAANGGISGLYSGQNAESAFRRDYSDDRYMSEQKALAAVLSDPDTMKMLENPDPKIRAAVIQSIEKKNPSLKNFGRYFSTAWSEGRQG